jgi:hypothetical protein
MPKEAVHVITCLTPKLQVLILPIHTVTFLRRNTNHYSSIIKGFVSDNPMLFKCYSTSTKQDIESAQFVMNCSTQSNQADRYRRMGMESENIMMVTAQGASPRLARSQIWDNRE